MPLDPLQARIVGEMLFKGQSPGEVAGRMGLSEDDVWEVCNGLRQAQQEALARQATGELPPQAAS